MATNTSADARPPQRGPVQDEREFQSVFDAVAQAIIEGRKFSFGQSLLARPLAARTVAVNYRPRP